mmetsp:Transcript_10972/g.25482  ORF Transcript_10972/g.25482 Transcript_10972/m.25482 type:complete len:116 (-) Transcript_10972:708-1055(-)
MGTVIFLITTKGYSHTIRTRSHHMTGSPSSSSSKISVQAVLSSTRTCSTPSCQAPFQWQEKMLEPMVEFQRSCLRNHQHSHHIEYMIGKLFFYTLQLNNHPEIDFLAKLSPETPF